MDIYLLRHAIAYEIGENGITRDDQRPLNPEGIEKLKAIATGLQNLDLTWDHIISSPYVRAKQTAQIVAESFDLTTVLQVNDALLPSTPTEKLLNFCSKFEADDSLLLVGHEPAMSTHFLNFLDAPRGDVDFKKAGIACFEFPHFPPQRGQAVLKWYVPPSISMRIGKKNK